MCGTSDLLMSCSSCSGSSQRSSRFRQLIRSYWKPVRCHSSMPSRLRIQSQAHAHNHHSLLALFLLGMQQNENSCLKPKHCFSRFYFPLSCILQTFSPLHKLNSQYVLCTVLSCFSKKNKTITKQPFKNTDFFF